MTLTYFDMEKVFYALLLVLVMFWCWYQWTFRKTLCFARKLPTVTASWPFIGHLLQCKLSHVLDVKEMVCFFLLDFSFRASLKNINHYCLWMGPKPYITVSNPEDIKVLLTKHLEKGEESDLLKFAVGNGLLTAPVEIWRPTKKALLPMFHPRNLEHTISNLNSKSRHLVIQLSKCIDQKDCKVQSKILTTTVLTTLDLIYGPEINFFDQNSLKKNAKKAVTSWFYLWTQRTISLLSRWDNLFHIIYRKSVADLKKSSSFVMDHANKVLVKQVIYLKENKSLMDVQDTSGQITMMDVFAPFMATNNNVTCEDFYHNVCTMLGAGAETTSFTLATCFLMLALHQDIQDKVYEEIISLVGESKEDVNKTDLNKLTYLDQVIKETMRRFPVIPTYSRRLTEDTMLSFGMVPAGSFISISVYGVHTDPKVYPNPLKFDPERFSSENVLKRHKFSFLPFGGGPRVCIGKDFAVMAMKVALVHTLREYKLTSSSQMKDITFVYNTELQFKIGYQVTISKRL